MSLLKQFLRIDSDRRAAFDTLRTEATQRRARIDALGQESKRKRDEIAMIEEGLHRLADDITRVEEEILEMDRRREDFEREAKARKVDAVKATFAADKVLGTKLAQDFKSLRAEFHAERARLLAQTDTGRMMDNYFQIETFLKDPGQPIPDAARKALLKERQDLTARIGPLVAPPPSPEGIFRATVTYGATEGSSPRAIVAVGLADEGSPADVTDLAATLLYGAYAAVAEKLGSDAPRPRRREGVLIFEQTVRGHSPDETALELFLAVEEGLKKAATAVAVRFELTGVFVEPEIASAVFANETRK